MRRTLVAIAVYVGVALAKRRARQHGYDLRELDSFIGWMLFLGFASAHALDAVLYHPRDVLARPWSLLYFWDRIGSFSGRLGALVGVVAWRRFRWEKWRLVRRDETLPERAARGRVPRAEPGSALRPGHPSRPRAAPRSPSRSRSSSCGGRSA